MKTALLILPLFSIAAYAQTGEEILSSAGIRVRGYFDEAKRQRRISERNPRDSYTRKEFSGVGSVVLEDPTNDSFQLTLASRASIREFNGGKLLHILLDIPSSPLIELRLSETAKAHIKGGCIEIRDLFGRASRIKVSDGGVLLVEERHRRLGYILDSRKRDLLEIRMSSSAGRRIHVE
jgi:hypothetical protein